MRSIFTMIMLLMTVSAVYAQDTQNPWHLLAFENEEEVAFYNTEMVTDIETTAQNVTIALDNGKKFTHPLATTTFGFDPRKEGTATTNESITNPQWTVYYANGRLHFNKTVNGIAVYTANGSMVAQFAGNYSEVSVHLTSGIYIVQAEGRGAKLAIGTSGYGNTTARAAEIKSVNVPVSISLRASNAIKIFWNITAGNSTTSIEIPNVEKFFFTVDNSIVFTMKNGDVNEIADYKESEFSDTEFNPIAPLTIKATSVENSISTIATVKAKISGFKYLPNGEYYWVDNEVASAKYENDGFELKFPATLPDDFLFPISEEMKSLEGITVSDIQANTGGVSIDAYDSNGKSIGSFELKLNGCHAFYMYADRSFTEKGNPEDENRLEFDCTYKKGWNIRYYSPLEGGRITTQNPLDEDFKWYFSAILWHEK